MFLPTSKQELKSLGWERPDVILVTGDTYIDSPHIGVALIGKYLLKHGFKTAVIAQPAMDNNKDITRLGDPGLFWGVTAGCIDSMVANYTAAKKFRNQDDYTPGGVNIRPNRAVIAYTILIRRYFKNTKPIVLGGLEASLRRIAHYDYWDDGLRRSILFDAKADILAYGMAEKTVVELAQALQKGADWKKNKGICYISNVQRKNNIQLNSFEEVSTNKKLFFKMSKIFQENIDNTSAGFSQKHGDRFLIHNPSQEPLSRAELDDVYELDFQRDVHPYYKTGQVKALETIKQSVTTHRGCLGQCNFCAIAVHQGLRVVSRSRQSIIDEVRRIKQLPGFNGVISDVGGPTANMYGVTCLKGWKCRKKQCLMPKICVNLKFGHKDQMKMLRNLIKIGGIKKVFISSGIRHDLVIGDKKNQKRYIEQLVQYHISGQIKLAPEHCEKQVLDLMNKPSVKSLVEFKKIFDKTCAGLHKNYFLTYYFMAAYPGCTLKHMRRLKGFLSGALKIVPEQVQIFTPLPATIAATMYYCQTDMTGRKIFCEKKLKNIQTQKKILLKNEVSWDKTSNIVNTGKEKN